MSSHSTSIVFEPGEPVTGYTLPDILYHAAASYTNPQLFGMRVDEEWQFLSIKAFRERCEHIALGLIGLGLEKGDRVAMFMESDTSFAVIDMACQLAGLVNVPLYLKQSLENNEYILWHSEAKVLIVTRPDMLEGKQAMISGLDTLQSIVTATREKDHTYPHSNHEATWHTLDMLAEAGEDLTGKESVESLKNRVRPEDLATIVYTSGTTGKPKGVMLTQQNISSNALSGYSELGMDEASHREEVAISFLPLTHMFARTIHYSNLAYGITTYFTTPEQLGEELKHVRPTLMAAVPRVVEKLYGKIVSKLATLTGIQSQLASWSLSVAKEYRMGADMGFTDRVKLSIADKILLSKWREALGGRVKFIIAGGAALSSTLVNLFSAAGVQILQGYGLTETSPVISFSRPADNYPGTVGHPLPGIEVKVAPDGELLTRGPHVMRGYYKNPAKTGEVLDNEGWFHTGDIGELTEEGCIRITDRKKDLFKLTTGKYVIPQPIENRLNSHALIAQSIVLGEGQKYCASLIFVDPEAVQAFADREGIPTIDSIESVLTSEEMQAYFEGVIADANKGMDSWTCIKQFRLMPEPLTVENGMLTPTQKVKRREVKSRFAEDIDALFAISVRHG